MSAFSVTLIGDLLEVLGVFFLSVEAIKLPNLYRLRDRFLLPLDHTLSPTTIQLLKTEWSPDERRRDKAAMRHFFISHYVGGLSLLIVLAVVAARISPEAFSSALRVIEHRPGSLIAGFALAAALWSLWIMLIATQSSSPLPPASVLVVTSLACFPVGYLLMALGEVCHQGSRLVVTGALRLLEFIDRGTPTGTIGLLGFFGVCLGKAVQLLAHTAS